MANFGKLNFAVAFNPQTAFPLDARYYFDSLTTAQEDAAAITTNVNFILLYTNYSGGLS